MANWESFTSSRNKGTMKLQTLRASNVQDLIGMINKLSDIDEEKINCATDAGLDGLVQLLNHEHPKIRALAESVVTELEKQEDEVVIKEGGYKGLKDMLRYKNVEAQRDALWTIATLAGNTELTHDGIVSEIGWPSILTRASAKVEDIQLPAVTLIANLCMNEEYHEMIIEEGGLELLKGLANSPNLKLKRAVCNAFANLCSEEENIPEVLGDGGIASLLAFVASGDEELVSGGLYTLANVCNLPEYAEQVLDGIAPVIELIKTSHITMVLKGAMACIGTLCETPEYQQRMMDQGLLDALLRVGKTSNPEIKYRLAASFNSLASNAEQRPALKDPQGQKISPVITLLKQLVRLKDPDTKKEAEEALAELGFKKKKKDGKAVPVVVADVGERERIQREQAERIAMKTEGRYATLRMANEASARSREGIERETVETDAQRQAAMREAIEKEAQEVIRMERAKLERERAEAEAREAQLREAIERQAEEARRATEQAQRQSQMMLEREREDILAMQREREEAQAALQRARLEQEELERNMSSMMDKMKSDMAGVEAERERMMREAQEASASSVGRSTSAMKIIKSEETYEVEEEHDIDDDYADEDDYEDDDDKREKAKIALVMVDLWEHNEDMAVTESALRKLGALAMKERNRKLIRIAGAIPILCEILKNADPKVGLTPSQSLALSVLAVLVRNVRNRDEVRKQEGLRHCLRIVKASDQEDLVNDLKALKELCKNEKNKVILRDGRLIEQIVPKILPENQPVQEQVLDIIAIISMNDVKSQVVVRDARGMPPIIKQIRHAEPEVQRRAIRALGNVSQNNRKIQQIVRKAADTIPYVVSRLADDNMEVRKAAGGAVAALAENEYANQVIIRKEGAIKMLCDNLGSSDRDDVKEQYAAAIRCMAKGNTKVQADFRKGPGFSLLVHALTSENIGLRIHATGAVTELCRDNSKNCDMICGAGAVHPLVGALETENNALQYLSEGAIWALARKSAKRRNMFREANAIEPLRILRTSDNPQVRKGAEWALEALGDK
eukprot:TRINITY_DN1585_c0_g1_i7.p1 TRINITY_DN1585_c0_g1~~TRINITY_DN1585_c0_g1_i7.p1  ORF type:complete len:1069 (+),score=466.60 TRINITY_DN1585_c0_g1_i7:129-3209(+)